MAAGGRVAVIAGDDFLPIFIFVLSRSALGRWEPADAGGPARLAGELRHAYMSALADPVLRPGPGLVL